MNSRQPREQRPDPETILERIRKEARGKLTVFLGATAGVGKTYTMLEAAGELLREQVDVVIGWVETHGRSETEKMAAALPRLPAKAVHYRGKMLLEMDVDAILARRPALVLVDELAHANAPGSRHARRFQDVEELLAAGIDVYTTLNIQHIESLNDVVAQITGIVVRETVPDSILTQADKVQLIDIPPEDLLKRLKEGKVYVPEQAEHALKKFFRPGNINALRELSLRFTASRVDQALSEYMREHHIDGPWPAAGRIMVCVSGSPFSAQLIRTASRLATGMQAECIAVHVEEPGWGRAGNAERDRVARNLRLAEELGAKSLSTAGENLADKILEIARTNNVTAIVIGKPRRSRLWELLRGSLVGRLIQNSGNINIYVIQTSGEPERVGAADAATMRDEVNGRANPYARSLLMVAAITGFSLLSRDLVDLGSIALLYQLPVVFSAFWWGRWPAYFSGVCSVLLYDFLFIPPFYTFSVNDIRHLWSFLIFLAVAFVIGGRTERLRSDAVAARLRETNTRALFDFSREIAAVIDLDTIAGQLAQRAAEALNRRVMVLLPDQQGKLAVRSEADPAGGQELPAIPRQAAMSESELAVAAWAYEHKQTAGRSTETLSGAHNLYLPLATRDHGIGVLGIYVVEKLITPEQLHLMEAWAGLAALAIERVKLAEKARAAALVLESDKLRTALLNSISHELRTPLASIMGASDTLIESAELYSAAERRELLENIKTGSGRMNLILSNLLDTARIESGMLKLKEDWCEIEDMVGAALRLTKPQLHDRRLDIDLPDELPLIRGDCVLLGQVLVNLIDNAAKYSPPGSGIEIQASSDDRGVTVSVADHGVGVAPPDLERIFDKFYRSRHEAGAIPGTGLGLPICRSIIEAHGGRIWAENRDGGGMALRFCLPAATGVEPPLPAREGE